jgi:hypothetical protein
MPRGKWLVCATTVAAGQSESITELLEITTNHSVRTRQRSSNQVEMVAKPKSSRAAVGLTKKFGRHKFEVEREEVDSSSYFCLICIIDQQTQTEHMIYAACWPQASEPIPRSKTSPKRPTRRY